MIRAAVPEAKICGLTHPDDALVSAQAGARYVGVVFAGGPRMLDPTRARVVLDGAGARARRVGVIGEQPVQEIEAIARQAQLDILQLHANPDATSVTEVQQRTGREVWAVVRIRDGELPHRYDELVGVAGAVLLDAFSRQELGGTGSALPWSHLARAMTGRPRPRRLVLAGGLRPDNVSMAVEALEPDVLDVSSGVEREIGRKDAAKIRAFVHAARGGR